MCSLWIVYYKDTFIIAINFCLSLAVFRFILNKLPFKWYTILEKVSIHTEILFLQVFFIITCSCSVFVENCILLPKGINEFVVFLCKVLIFYPFTHIFIIGHKGTIFPKTTILFQSAFFFIVRYKNVASKSFYQSKIHPFPLMLMQINEMWYTYTPLGI